AEAPHGSQTLAPVSEFSQATSLSASHLSAAKGAVISASVTPVRRGSAPASQAREPDCPMPEHGSSRPGDDRQDLATVLLPVAEVARRLQVSAKWVRGRIDAGEIDVVRIGGTRRRVSEAALAASVRRGPG